MYSMKVRNRDINDSALGLACVFGTALLLPAIAIFSRHPRLTAVATSRLFAATQRILGITLIALPILASRRPVQYSADKVEQAIRDYKKRGILPLEDGEKSDNRTPVTPPPSPPSKSNP